MQLVKATKLLKCNVKFCFVGEGVEQFLTSLAIHKPPA